MGHDQFFKDFFRAFFRDFLELFYPEISARLDFGTLRFLEKELFTDFPEGSLREADVVAELETRDGVKERTQHFVRIPRHENGWTVASHPSPRGRHSSTALPCLLEFCYPHQ